MQKSRLGGDSKSFAVCESYDPTIVCVEEILELWPVC